MLEEVLSHLLDFYSKFILRNEYAITYLDNNYYSLTILVSGLWVGWSLGVTLPCMMIHMYWYFKTTTNASHSPTLSTTTTTTTGHSIVTTTEPRSAPTTTFNTTTTTTTSERSVTSSSHGGHGSSTTNTLSPYMIHCDHSSTTRRPQGRSEQLDIEHPFALHDQEYREVEMSFIQEQEQHRVVVSDCRNPSSHSDDEQTVMSCCSSSSVSRTRRQYHHRSCFHVFTYISFLVSCLLMAIVFLLSSTFSKIHFMWSSLFMTSVLSIWVMGVFVLDFKRLVVEMLCCGCCCRRQQKKCCSSTISALVTTIEEGQEEGHEEDPIEELIEDHPMQHEKLLKVTHDPSLHERDIDHHQISALLTPQVIPSSKFKSHLSSMLNFCLKKHSNNFILPQKFCKPYIANKPFLFTTLVLCMVVSLIFLFCTLLSYSLYHICIATDPIEISTLFSRTVLSNRTCPLDDICFTYLTAPERMNSQMIVNFQISLSSSNHFLRSFVEFNKFDPKDPSLVNSNQFWSQQEPQFKKAHCFRMENIFEEIRYQCMAELTALDSDSSYIVRAIFEDTSIPSQRHTGTILKFRTTPSEENSKKNIAFLNGGDLSWREPTMALAKFVQSMGDSKQDAPWHSSQNFDLTNDRSDLAPYFAIVGGDVSYDNGCAACYRRWDDWFQKWTCYMTTTISYPTGGDTKKQQPRTNNQGMATSWTSHTYTLPILTAVGNHEAGNFMRSRSDNAYYIRYFPMSISKNGEMIRNDGMMEDPQFTRPLQHVHFLSRHTMIVVLDSWVHESPQEQVHYLLDLFEHQVRNEQYVKNRIVVIHHPMYSSETIKTIISKEMIHSWECLFLKYNVTAVFENHVHAYKQTYPIKEGQVTTTKSDSNLKGSFTYQKQPHEHEQHGIVYIGDGSWGVTNWDPSLDFDNPIFRQVGYVSHVFHVNTRELESGEALLELSALGYNSTSETIYQVEGSRLRILTG